MHSPRISRRRIRAVAPAAVATVAGLVASAACAGDGDADDAARQAVIDAAPAAEQRDPLRSGPQGNIAQFIVDCELSHLAYDDPIVLPDEPGLSHLHQFFGNVEVDADPTYERVIGADTSCDRARDTASYWAPALLDGDGDIVEPLKMTAYYRPGPGIDPTSVEPYPPSLMMVAGDASAEAAQPIDVVAWSCGTGALRATVPPDCRDTTDLAARATAEAGSSLRLMITFPDCWDGTSLTSYGTGAHVRYSADGACPTEAPVPIPQLQMAIDYPAVDPAELTLSSGAIETAHADFWNVWDQEKLEEEVRFCLNRDLVCGVAG